MDEQVVEAAVQSFYVVVRRFMTPRKFSEALHKFSEAVRTFSEARCAVLSQSASFYNVVRRSEAWCAVLCYGAPFYVVVREDCLLKRIK